MLKLSLVSSFLLAVALSGCATVSMVPGVSTVQTSISDEQSALRANADMFSEKAKARGWISPSRGLFNIARILVDGQSGQSDAPARAYADFIGAQTRSHEEVLATVLADGKDARLALASVTAEASGFLSGEAGSNVETARRDLISYERVLVQAQQTRRSFAQAVAIAGLADTGEMREMFAALDAEIDSARALAGKLASQHAGRDRSEAVS